MIQVGARETLAELGLLSLDAQDSQNILDLLEGVFNARLGRRVSTLLGPAGLEAFEQLTKLQETPDAFQRAMAYFNEALPDVEQYAEDEFRALKADFLRRMADAMAATDAVTTEQ